MCHHLGRRRSFREGRIAAQVGEQDCHLDFTAAQGRVFRMLDQGAGHIGREVLVNEPVDTLVQRADEPALDEHGSLRSFEQVGPDASAHHRCHDDRNLQRQL